MGSFFEVLLVDVELLSDLWSRLLSQDVLELDVELLLLLNKYVFLRDFLCFCNEPFLKRLDLLDHFISIRISAFELSPSVNVEWLLKLVIEVLGLLLLLQELLLKKVDFSLKIGNTCSLILRNNEVSFEPSNLLSYKQNVIKSLLIVYFSLFKSTFLNFDFFVKDRKLFVSLDKLGTKNISLIDNHFIIFPLLLLFRFGFTDYILQPSNVTFLGFNHFLRALDVPLDILDVAL